MRIISCCLFLLTTYFVSGQIGTNDDKQYNSFYNTALKHIDKEYSKQKIALENDSPLAASIKQNLQKKFDNPIPTYKEAVFYLDKDRSEKLILIKKIAIGVQQMPKENDAFTSIAIQHFKNGDIDKAFQILENESGNVGEKGAFKLEEDSKSNRKKQLLMARFSVLAGKSEQAEKYFEKLIKSDDVQFEESYDYLIFLKDNRNHKRTLEIGEKAIKLTNNSQSIADVYGMIGLASANSNNMEEATAAYGKALDLYKNLAETVKVEMYLDKVGYLLYELAGVYSVQKNYPAAQKAYEDAEKVFTNFDDYKFKILSLYCKHKVGNLYFQKGDYINALAKFEDIEKDYESVLQQSTGKYLGQWVNYLNQFGYCYYLGNSYEKSLSVFKKTLAANLSLKDKYGSIYQDELALTYLNRGILKHYAQKLDDASGEYRQAIKEYEYLEGLDKNYNLHLSKTYNHLGKLEADNNQFEKALNYFELAGKYLGAKLMYDDSNSERHVEEEMMDRGATENNALLAEISNNKGTAYYQLNSYKKSKQNLVLAKRIWSGLVNQNKRYDSNLADTYNNLGNLYADENNDAAALQAYNEALEIKERIANTESGDYQPSIIHNINSIGELYPTFKSGETAETYRLTMQKVLPRSFKMESEITLADTAYRLANLYSKKGDKHNTKLLSQKALDIYSKYANLAVSKKRIVELKAIK